MLRNRRLKVLGVVQLEAIKNQGRVLGRNRKVCWWKAGQDRYHLHHSIQDQASTILVSLVPVEI